MDTIRLFEALDRSLGDIFADFATLADQIEFQEVCNLNDEMTISQQAYAGVYMIEMKTGDQHSTIQGWAQWFKAEWDHEMYAKKFVPTTKKKRLKSHQTLKDWMPVYLGKSKRIASRVLEHINLGLDKPTFAMKLRARGDFFTKNTFRLSTAHIDIVHYDLIMPMVERSLRRRLNPVVGKQ